MMTTLEAYYRLGDNPGSYSVKDSSGNGNTGSLINGLYGEPTFGAQGVMVFDPDCALDCTAGQNVANGGFNTNDYSTEGPTIHDPLGESSAWSLELWFQWTGATATPAPAIIPPGLTTPITESSGFPEAVFSGPAAASVVVSSGYSAVGDLAVLGIYVTSGTVTVESVDGEVSENWTLQVRNQDAANGQCMDIWSATITSTAAPDVLTITYSVDSPVSDCYYFISNLTAGQGANTIWGFPDTGINSGNTNTTVVTYPALSAANDTNPQIYWGLGGSSGTMSNGSTGGFDYTTVTAGQIAVNLDVYSGGNPWQATAPTTSGKFAAAAMVIEASISTAASTSAVPNATIVHIAAPNEFEPFTAYELQLGFVEIPTSIPGQTVPITNAVVEAFLGVDEYNIYSFATNPLDGGWHHLVRCSANEFPYLDGQPPTSSTFNQAIGANIAGLSFGTSPTGVGIDPNDSSPLSTAAQPFTGYLDEVALYTGTLSQTQVTDHYNTALWLQQQEIGAADGPASASRLGKVLAICGLDPSVILNVPYPWGILLYAESDTTINTSGLNYEQSTSQTEDGIIFQGPDGYIYAYSGRYQYLNPTSTVSQGLFSDNDLSEFYYDGPSLAIAGDDVDEFNQVQVQSGIPATATTEQIEVGQLQNWGPPQSAVLAQSASVYGNRTLQGLTSLQMAHDSDALGLAQYLAAIFYKPIERVTQITLNSQGNGGANIPQMLQRTLWQRITVSYQGQTEGPPFTQDSLIESVSHNVNMDWPQWDTTWATSPYEILLPAFYMDSSATDGTDVLIY